MDFAMSITGHAPAGRQVPVGQLVAVRTSPHAGQRDGRRPDHHPLMKRTGFGRRLRGRRAVAPPAAS